MVTRLSKLDAVNQILGSCGLSPVNAIDGSTSKNTRIAVNQLEEADRQIQSDKWHFNTDPDFTFSADAVTGEIPLPASVISFHTHCEPWIHVRGDRLYDREKQTFSIGQAKSGVLVSFLEWDDLPELAKKYIVAKAARKMYSSFVGSRDNRENLMYEERSAMAALKDDDYENAQHSMLDDPYLPYLHGSNEVPGSPRNNPML